MQVKQLLWSLNVSVDLTKLVFKANCKAESSFCDLLLLIISSLLQSICYFPLGNHTYQILWCSGLMHLANWMADIYEEVWINSFLVCIKPEASWMLGTSPLVGGCLGGKIFVCQFSSASVPAKVIKVKPQSFKRLCITIFGSWNLWSYRCAKRSPERCPSRHT